MLFLLRATFDRVIKRGNVTVIDADGALHEFGDGSGQHVCLRLKSRATEWRLVFNPTLEFGEAYMDGRLIFDDGQAYDFLDIFAANAASISLPRWTNALGGLRYAARWIRQFNPVGRAKRNIAHHYDLDGRLYQLFLDKDQQYSCAYFENENATLEEAQTAKKRHLAAKLDLNDGHRLLDIGSGWGGLALHLANYADISVTGITLSEEQLQVSQDRARSTGNDTRISFKLQDYRTLEGKFDRIVSVGMMEHVGVVHYGTYFRRIQELLNDDGVAVVHSIGRSDGPGVTNPWIQKYIFPGGYIPAISEVLPAIERSGLYVTDVEILRLHYAETLRHWRERFMSRWSEAASIYDERFCRMWEFYLAGSEMAFRREGLMVFQIQLARDQNTLPLTRDYMLDKEREYRKRDGEWGAERQSA